MILACSGQPGDVIDGVVFAAFGMDGAVAGMCGGFRAVPASTPPMTTASSAAKVADVSLTVSKVRRRSVGNGGMEQSKGKGREGKLSGTRLSLAGEFF